MKKILIALFSLAAVVVISITITGEPEEKAAENEKTTDTYLQENIR